MAFPRRLASLLALLLCVRAAEAAPPTPGYPEPVVQWGVQKGETCEDIAQALYGSAKHAPLLQRYNRVACKAGATLKEGTTLVLPEKPTTLPDARLRSMNPDVRARSGGAGWSPAASGMPLFSNYNVNTLDQGRADIEFVDRTRVFLAPNTLVVIYGTASQTRVSRSAPVNVEVESGEVKAGLAALRGDAVEVAVKGGGRVSAASRDTVVQRKGDRTTVEVFDGKAGVQSGGKQVDVPKNFGSRFVGVAPPVPPRPLPPAPIWAAGGTGSVALTPGDKGVITATWNPSPVAIAYRVELSRDEGFRDLVSREEVPATINAFRAEQLPLGTYYLAVRTIDKEEYLGIASEVRAIRIVHAAIEAGGGKVDAKEIEANPYGELRLGDAEDVEVALDDGPFGPAPAAIDLRRRPPHELRMRPRGGSIVSTITVRYVKVEAAIEARRSGDGRSLDLRVKLSGVDGVDVPTRIGPTARIHLPEGVRTVTLAPGAAGELTGSLPWAPPAGNAPLTAMRVDIIDARGASLGSINYSPDVPPPALVRPPSPQIGPFAPFWRSAPAGDVTLFAPVPPSGASTGVGLAHGKGGWTFQGLARATGAVGPLGLEAALRTSTTDGESAGAEAWLGARFRAVNADLGGSTLVFAPAVRVGVPASAGGVPAQVEPGIALGGVASRFTWLVDLGGRLRVGEDKNATDTPPGQAFLLAGSTLDVLSWLRLEAWFDTHLVLGDSGAKRGLTGLGAGLEAGGPIYGSLSLYASPWSDPGIGPFAAQLSVGFRGTP